MSIVGVTECPECANELEPVGSTDGRPIQTVSQSCGSCSYETDIGLLWYPNKTHDIVATLSDVEAQKKEPCERCHTNSDIVVVEPNSPIPRYYCSDCVRAHHKTTTEAIRNENARC